MKKKVVLVIAALGVCVVIFLLLAGVKFLQIRAAIAQYANFAPPPDAISTIVAEEEDWTPELHAVGSLTAVQGVMVTSDQPGIVSAIDFESGEMVQKGDLLVQLDVSQETAQLRSAEAQLRLAALNLQRQQNLVKSRVTAQADLDAAQAEFDQASARVQEVRSLIDKKTIKAPFSGVIGIRQVNLGEYLQSGAKVASLQSLDPIYADFYLPQQTLGDLSKGQGVIINADGLAGQEFKGEINAIDSIVDEATRNVRVQATLANADHKLRPGMYVDINVPLTKSVKHISLPATAIQYAPYGDSVFVVEEMKDPKGNTYKGVRQQVVQVGPAKGDRVSIISGVKAGDEVATSGVFKLRQGSSVQINNSIQPSNETAPKPEDT